MKEVWSPADSRTGIFVSKKRNSKLTATLKGGYVITYHCAGCEKFIIDEATLEK